MEWIDVKGVGRVALNAFSPSELEIATALTADMQRVWRRRGHLPARDGGRTSFNAREAAAIAVRLELARFGVPPSHTIAIGDEAAATVLYSALLSRSNAAEVRGPFSEVARVAASFAADDRLASAVTGADGGRRYLWSHTSTQLQFADDIVPIISDERCAAMLVLDLTVIGVRLADRAPKPLFLIDVRAG
jgi:hypothetical protein